MQIVGQSNRYFLKFSLSLQLDSVNLRQTELEIGHTKYCKEYLKIFITGHKKSAAESELLPLRLFPTITFSRPSSVFKFLHYYCLKTSIIVACHLR